MVKISRKATIAVYSLILFLLAIYWFPLLWIFLTSIRTRQETLAYPPVWMFKPTMESYIYVLTESPFLLALLNSILVAGVSTIIVMGMAIPAGYALARFKFPGRDDIGFYIISTKMAPPIVVLFAFYLLFFKLGLLRTHAGLIILHIALNLSLATWLLKGFFEKTPKEIEEAAKVDGCSDLKVLQKITLPLTYPGILVTMILCLMFSWMEFIFASTITDPITRTVPVFIYSWLSFSQIYWERVAVAGILYMLPMLIFALVIRNDLVKGMSFGLVK